MMFGATTKLIDKSRNVNRAAEKANFVNLGQAAGSIRKVAARSIRGRVDPRKSSPEGTAPFTHKGSFFRRALRFDVDKVKQEALIGFQFSKIGVIAAIHEFGETEEGRDYPVRPTIGPAFQERLGQIAGQWQHTIG